MDSMIVTITDLHKTFMYDVEVPNNVILEALTCDIAEALNGYNAGLTLDGNRITLFCSRLNRTINPNETLEGAGVWNGDFLIIQGGR